MSLDCSQQGFYNVKKITIGISGFLEYVYAVHDDH